MGYNLKTFEEFINENSVYHNSEPILETDGAAVMKKWNSILITIIIFTSKGIDIREDNLFY